MSEVQQAFRIMFYIVLVVLIGIAAYYLFIAPISQIQPVGEETSTEEETISSPTYSGLYAYIEETDTTLDIIGKFFRYFNPDYLSRLASTNKRLFTEFVFDTNNYPSNYNDEVILLQYVVENFTRWTDSSSNYEFSDSNCNAQYTDGQDASLNYNNGCWTDVYTDKLSKCKMAVVTDPTPSQNIIKLKIRVGWYEEKVNDIIHVYPLITICRK